METNKDDFSLIHITEDSSDCKNIEQLIVNVRGRQVMLDRDLASLYGDRKSTRLNSSHA